MVQIPFEGNPIGAVIGGETPPTPVPIPTSGLVFYTPASGTTDAYAETGQSLDYSGGTATSKDNVPCVHLNGSNESIVTWDVSELPEGNSPFTMSIWAQMDTNVGDRTCEAFSYGYPDYYQAIYLGAGRMYDGLGQAKFGDHLPDIWCENTIEKDEWYHLLQTYDGEYFNCYLNGVLISSEYCTDMNVNRGALTVGGGGAYFGEYWAGYVAAPRLYDRVLTSGEINALAHEFTPMTVPTFNDQTITFTNDVGATTISLKYNAGSKTVSFDILSGTLPNTVTFNPSGSFTYDGTTIAASATYQLAVQLSGDGVVTTSANVTIEMKDHEEIPTRGLTMWHSLSSSLTHPEIGDDFELTDNSITLTTNQGIHCAQYIGNYGGLRNSTGSYYSTSNTEVTVSVWAKYTGDTGDYWMDVCPMSIGNWANADAQIEISMMNYGNLGTRIKVQNASDYNLTGYFSGWHHYVATLSGNGSNPKLYIDGEYIGEQDVYGNQIDVIQAVGIGGSLGSDNYIPRDRPWVGYIAGCRIYNRALEPNEILKLAGEYIPLTDALFGNQEFNFSNSEGASSRSMWFDVENKTPVFTVVSGSLPNGVTMDSTLGTFAYDGTTIAQDEDIQVVVELSGNYVSPASAVVTFKMTDQAIVDTNDYFYMENIGDNANGTKIIKAGNPTNPITVEWSKDKSSWYEFILDGNSIPLAVNEKVYFRGNNSTFSDSNGVYSFWVDDNNEYGHTLHNIGGNIMSLLDKTCQSTTLPTSYVFKDLFHPNGWSNWWVYNSYDLKLPAMTLTEHCYEEMFYECYNMVTHPELPASSLARCCYKAMFRSTSIQTAPVLSADCAYGCYERMFEYCHSLQTAPELTGNINQYCYSQMFYGCNSLTTPPSILPAETIAWYNWYCYGSMFADCVSLTYSPVIMARNEINMAAGMFYGCSSLSCITIPNLEQWGNGTSDWVNGVASEGVFNCSPTLPKEFGNSRIPVGWKKNPDLLYFQAMEDNSAVKLAARGNPAQVTLSTSYDGANWTPYTIGDTLTLQNTGDFVFFKGNNNAFSTGTYNDFYRFEMSGSIDAKGNIMSLLKEDANLTAIPSGADACFANLFMGQNALRSAPELPATTLTPWCYYAMFQDCQNLSAAPELPATTLAAGCYSYMFNSTVALRNAPKLPATTLAPYCYDSMFMATYVSGAVSLPATSGAEYCYNNMFRAADINEVNIKLKTLDNYCCQNMFKEAYDLTKISVGFTDWGTNLTDPFTDWVYDVSSSQPTGTFSCPSGLPEEYGDSRIPSGWSVSHDIDPIVTSGLTFFQPFARSYITPQVGHDLTLSGTAPTLSSVNGVDCVVFDGNQLLYDTNADYWTMPGDEAPRYWAPDMTVSMWVNVFNFTDGDILNTGGAHGYDQGNGVSIGQNENYDSTTHLWCDYQGHYRIDYSNAVANQWYHIAWKTYDDGWMSVYVNGQYIGSDARGGYKQLNHPFIGLACYQDNETLVPRPQNCAIAGFRIYDRTLEDSEIALLAAEF